MAYVHTCVEEQMMEYIKSRYPNAVDIGKPFWYLGCCEIQFYPNKNAVDPYALIYRFGNMQVLTEF